MLGGGTASAVLTTDYFFVSEVVRYALVLAMFFLAFWRDGMPRYIAAEDGI